MNPIKTILMMAMIFLLSATAFGQSQKIKIGLFDVTGYDTCGTSLTFDGSPYNKLVFIHNADGTWMLIDGKKVRFKFLKSTRKADRNERKGDKFTDTYSSKDYKLSIKYTVKGFEDDVTLYDAVMILTRGKASRTVNLVGSSSC